MQKTLSGELQKVALRDPNDALDELSVLLERWNKRLAIDNLALAERYLKGEIIICCVIRAFGHGFNPQQYVAIFEGIPSVLGPDGYRRCLEGLVLPGDLHSELESEVSIGRAYRDDGTVFVENVQFMDLPKGAVPSLVRLESPDKAFSRVRGSLYFSRRVGFKTVRRLSDWEVSSALDLVPVGLNQSACEKVEGGAQVMNEVADEGRPFAGDFPGDADAIRYISGARMLVADDAIWVFPPKGILFGYEIVDVLFGPFDFDAGRGQRVIGHG